MRKGTGEDTHVPFFLNMSIDDRKGICDGRRRCIAKYALRRYGYARSERSG